MKKVMICALFAVVLSLCGPGQAYAADYEAGWGAGLDGQAVEARAFLRQEAARLCAPDDSDTEKIRKLNRYVCDKVGYDYITAAGGLERFVYGDRVICSGYAEALAYLLDCVNVKNFILTGSITTGESAGLLHMWNAVYLDGNWLHVDPTWNDATRGRAHPDGAYFLASCARMAKERRITPKTQEDYDALYALLRTVTVSLGAGENAAKDGEPLVPARETVHALGGYVKEEDSGKVSVILGIRTLEMTAGSEKGLLDGGEFTFDTAPETIGGTVMMPARAALDALGAAVTYDTETHEITITYDPYIPSDANTQPPRK